MASTLFDPSSYLRILTLCLQRAKANFTARNDPDGYASFAGALSDPAVLDTIGKVYAALLAAGRESEAHDYAMEARRWFDARPVTLALVRWALAAGQPRRVHLDWLRALPADPAVLLASDVQTALAASAQPGLATDQPVPPSPGSGGPSRAEPSR